MPSPELTAAMLDDLDESAGEVTESFTKLKTAIAPILRAMSGSLAGVTPQIKSDTSSAEPASASGPAGGGGLAAITGAMSGMVGAIQQFKGAFLGFVGKITPFVEAFSPSSVQAFQMALRDTTAVIGSALVPVMQLATGVMRGVGDALVPVMQQLAPIVAKLTEAFSRVIGIGLTYLSQLMSALLPIADLFTMWAAMLEPIVKIGMALATVMTSLVGAVVKVAVELTKMWLVVLQPLFTVLGGVADVFRGFSVIVSGLVNTLGAMFGKLTNPLQGAAETLKNTLTQLSKYVVLAVAAFAKFIGWTSIIEGMKKALAGNVTQGASGGMAAAQNAQVTDMASLARSLAAAAAVAMGDGGKTPEDQWRDDVLEGLKKVESGELSMEKILAQIEKVLLDLPGKMAAALQGGARSVIQQGTHTAGSATMAAAATADIATGGLFSSIGRGYFAARNALGLNRKEE